MSTFYFMMTSRFVLALLWNPDMTTRPNPSETHREYLKEKLSKEELHEDPLIQFSHWMQFAIDQEIPDANAASLATATVDAIPSVRIVLLRAYDEKGFAFYTNYHSRKAIELIENPLAELLLFWQSLERQVRIFGTVVKSSAEESDGYFRKRPRNTQLGTWASDQSTVLNSREDLRTRFQEAEEQYEGEEVPRPNHWGGFRLQPIRYEFWQGREFRLHDRFCYSLDGEGNWRIERLAP